MAASFHDGSSLSEDRLFNSRLEMRTTLKMRSGDSRSLETKTLKMSSNGVWEYKLDMKSELRLEGPDAFRELNDIGKPKQY